MLLPHTEEEKEMQYTKKTYLREIGIYMTRKEIARINALAPDQKVLETFGSLERFVQRAEQNGYGSSYHMTARAFIWAYGGNHVPFYAEQALKGMTVYQLLQLVYTCIHEGLHLGYDVLLYLDRTYDAERLLVQEKTTKQDILRFLEQAKDTAQFSCTLRTIDELRGYIDLGWFEDARSFARKEQWRAGRMEGESRDEYRPFLQQFMKITKQR